MTAIARAEIWNTATLDTSIDREEAGLVARARTGDEAAIRWLLTRYRERAVRLASAVLRRSSEAEDVVQEAFIRAFQRIKGLRNDSGFGRWLFRIVVRLCVDRTRSARWSAESGDADLSTACGSSDSPEAVAVVDALLVSLSPPLRAALVLREIEGLDYEEIAVVLSIPVGTVRSRLSAARQQFRRLWLEVDEEVRQ